MPIEIRRVLRTKDKAKANYNRLSRWYDWVSGSSEEKYRNLGLKKLDIQSGEQVLEIGFGTGHCILALVQAVGSAGKVAGIDISEGMLKISQERIARAGLTERVDLRTGDAAHLPFDAEAFDAIFMSFTLELFDTPEIPQVLKECWKTLRPGGRLCTVNMTKKNGGNLAVRIYEWFHDRMPTAVDCRPIFAQPALREAGFHITDITEMLMWGLPVEIILAHKDQSSPADMNETTD
jgi:ubiquinone/menaquinone biosynthesis C-methylase UbiE